MVAERVSTLEIRKRLGELLDRVALRKDHFVIERKGKALAALVPASELARLDLLARRYILDVLERQRGGRLTQAEADRLADDAKHRTRKRRGGTRRARRP
jgi:PHD/YefM family antitoxin component YafN of YafNO toxin-antitoxin module